MIPIFDPEEEAIPKKMTFPTGPLGPSGNAR